MSNLLMIYTDGGCHGNPGPGGWAYVILAGDDSGGSDAVQQDSGFDRQTTNNRMELTAVIQALEWIDQHEPAAKLRLVTDSQYVKNGITVWIHSWLRNGWQTSAKKPVKNRDLWQRLHAVAGKVSVEWAWTRGHSGDTWNEVCDSMVQQAIAAAG